MFWGCLGPGGAWDMGRAVLAVGSGLLWYRWPVGAVQVGRLGGVERVLRMTEPWMLWFWVFCCTNKKNKNGQRSLEGSGHVSRGR